MPDRKPAKLIGDERATLQSLLQFQRDSVVRKVADLDDDAARRRFVDSDTTLLWLLKHLSYAETIWVLLRFAGQDIDLPDNEVHPTDTLAAAIDTYRDTWATVDAVVAAAPSLDATCRAPDESGDVNLRWILMHLLEETARHAGHADILRELLDGQTGR